MKRLTMIFFLGFILLMGCSDEDSPTEPTRNFEGITERNEWGDTLSVDEDDWYIFGGIISDQKSPTVSVPCFRNGKTVSERTVAVDGDDYQIGAFPNPFVPGAGRLLIDLVIPEPTWIELTVEDESGDIQVTIFEGELVGVGQIAWSGTNADGNQGINLPNGIYRVFYDAGIISTHGDVQIIQSRQADPATDEGYVLYLQENYLFGEYLEYEYSVAADFGWDGIPGGEVYPLPIEAWVELGYTDKFQYLPFYMNYNLYAADSYQYHWLVAFKHFQFGAGWPDGGDIGVPDPELPEWQKTNVYHNNYLDIYPEEGP